MAQENRTPLPELIEQFLSGGNDAGTKEVLGADVDMMGSTESTEEEVAHQSVAEEVADFAADLVDALDLSMLNQGMNACRMGSTKLPVRAADSNVDSMTMTISQRMTGSSSERKILW